MGQKREMKKETVVDRAAFIEGLLVLASGLMCIVEGIRLIADEKLHFYDIFGPGRYIFGLGLVLIILGLVYVVSHRRKGSDGEKLIAGKGEGMRMISIIAVMAIYNFLIPIIGYLLASVVFFFMILWVVGFRSWLMNGVLSIGIGFTFYIFFNNWLNMQFPRGVVFR